MVVATGGLAIGPPDDLLEEHGFPDVYEVSFEEYREQGEGNFQVKALQSIYLEALVAEASLLRDRLVRRYSDAPELPALLDSAHTEFLEHARAWSGLCEELTCWDLEAGIRLEGSGGGYAYSETLSRLLWQRIIEYSRLLGLRPDSSVPGSVGTDEPVGGYRPWGNE
jgi:hypothetical protein